MKFQISNHNVLKSSTCDFSVAYILVKKNISIIGAGVDPPTQKVGKRNKQVTFKNYAPFTNCISEIAHM